MPRNGFGQYSLPQAPFVPGTTISSSAVNSDFSDIATALTDSIAADGQTPITGSFKLADGSALGPSYSFSSNSADGMHHPASGELAFALNGVDTFIMEAPSASTGSGLLGLSGAVLMPIGVVHDFAGSSAPSGWFLCYGQAVSRTTYSELFAVIGTTFGSGDGSTTYNLPDLRGRASFGKDDMGGSAANRITNAGSGITGTTLGANGGAQSVTLVTANLPTTGLTITVTDPGHTHALLPGGQTGDILGSSAGGASYQAGPSLNNVGVANVQSNTTGITASGSLTGATGTPYSVMNPTLIMNKIIFAGHP